MAKTPEKWLKAKRKYNDQPEMRRRNALQKKAWRAEVKAGRIHPGDGKAVDHIHALDSGGGNAASNLRVIPATKNKGWRKGTSTYSPAKGRLNK
jgi:5-methylcytosine-specific restriction endonuclease McrA